MVSQKNKELFALMDKLHEHKEQLDYYAIKRTKTGRRIPNRIEHLEKHALKIYLVSNEIITHLRSMKRT